MKYDVTLLVPALYVIEAPDISAAASRATELLDAARKRHPTAWISAIVPQKEQASEPEQAPESA